MSNKYNDLIMESLKEEAEESFDFGCSKHQIDYRIACEECQEKNNKIRKWVKEQFEKRSI